MILIAFLKFADWVRGIFSSIFRFLKSFFDGLLEFVLACMPLIIILSVVVAVVYGISRLDESQRNTLSKMDCADLESFQKTYNQYRSYPQVRAKFKELTKDNYISQLDCNDFDHFIEESHLNDNHSDYIDRQNQIISQGSKP